MNPYGELWNNARALVILKVIYDLGRPAQVQELTSLTGGDHQTASKYCHTLATMGLLTRVTVHAGWSLTAQGFAFMQTPASYPQLLHNASRNPLNSADSGGLIPTTKPSQEAVAGEVLSGNSGFLSENLRFYQQIGITLNPQTEFLAGHVDPKVMRAEWKKLEEKQKPWPGLLIKILSSRPQPVSEREKRKRYGDWDQERRG